MKRRTFLLLGIITLITRSFSKNTTENEFIVLKEVLNHLFPTTDKFKGASVFKGIDYILFVSKHPSFDKEDLNFIIRGTKEIINLNKNFINLSKKEKERLLREFEQTTFGSNWLNTLMYYGLEAMLGDPIYGGNKNLSGWKNIDHTPPVPMAKKPFGGINHV